jgi:diadenylate cyclase
MKKTIELDEMDRILEFVAPGTELRKGLDNILDAGTGGLIVIGGDTGTLKIADGGFFINCDYTPQKVYELAKMDGAIILDKDISKIISANVQLQPSADIDTDESGTRHRTAERVAKQTGNLIIAVSQRRKIITLYKESIRCRVRNINDVMGEANQAVKTLERYRSVLEKTLNNLTIMEFDDLVTLYEAVITIQRFEMLFRVGEEVKKCIIELGNEGRLIKMQMDELLKGTEEEMIDLIFDYYNDRTELMLDEILYKLRQLTQEELLEIENICEILGYGKDYNAFDDKIIPKGYRLLAKNFKLTRRDIENIIDTFSDFNNIMEASVEELAEVKGIQKFKSKSIKNGLNRLKITVLLER